ncbi:MAG: transporter substrate-binding domain-containing protein [Pseudomonadota bacterium]
MKKHMCGPIMMISMMFCVPHALAETIKIGYFMLPPLQYMDETTRNPKGASKVYFGAMASQLGYEVEWVGPLPLFRLSNMLESGKLDGSLGFVKNPELERFLYYVATPLYFAQPTLIVRKDNPLSRIRSIEDIRGYRIGTIVTMSGRYTPLIDAHRHMLTIEALGGDMWIKQNLRKLIDGRVDAIFDRQPYSVPFIAVTLQLDTRIKLLPLPEPATPMYIVFSKASAHGQKLLEQCNALLPKFHLAYEELAKQELKAANDKNQ